MKKIVEKIILIVLIVIFTSNCFCYADLVSISEESMKSLATLDLNILIIIIGGTVVFTTILSNFILKFMEKKTNKKNIEKEGNKEIKKYEIVIYVTFIIVEVLMLINMLSLSLSAEEAIIFFIIGLILFIISIILRKKKKKIVAYIVSIATILIIILGSNYITTLYPKERFKWNSGN